MSNTSGVAESGSGDFEVFCGIDVAREVHHAVALDDHGQRLIDRPLPNAEPDLVGLFEELKARGRVLVAKHLVNLAWNGLAGLEAKPRLTDGDRSSR